MNIVSQDGITYSANNSKNDSYSKELTSEIEYLQIELKRTEFDSIEINKKPSPFSLLNEMPRPFKIGLYAFLIFFALMTLLTIILSFF